MNDITPYDFFEPLVKYIYSINSNGFIEMFIPGNLSIDFQKLKVYFNDDVIIRVKRNKVIELKGTLKEEKIIQYLMNASRNSIPDILK